MKTTINQIQNPIDYESYVNEHLIQALANSGNRLGIKGDSIIFKEFTFADILGNKPYDINNDIGIMYYDNIQNAILDENDDSLSDNKFKKAFKVNFGYCPKDKCVNAKSVLANKKLVESSINIYDCLTIEDKFFDGYVNNIESYKGFIHNNSKYLTLILKAKYQGYYDNAENNCELQWFKFNIDENYITDAFKIYHLDLDDVNEENDYYVLLHIERKEEHKYYLHIYPFNTRFLDEDPIYKELFISMFNYANGNYTDKPGNDLAYDLFINYNFVNIDNLLKYEINNSNSSIVAAILNNEKNNIYINDVLDRLYSLNQNSHPITLSFNTEDSEYFSVKLDDDPYSINKNLIDYFRQTYNINVNKIINELNNDCSTLYYNFLKYYNNEYYLTSKENLLKHLLCKLYEDSIDEDMFDSEYSNIMYIPFDYKFTYMCNSNNEMDIYYSNDIYVTYSNLENNPIKVLLAKNINNVIIDYYGLTKTKIYTFYLKYNLIYKDLINAIIINPLYTFPYINDKNTWTINEYDTNIPAIGKDAGNPNIIMEYYNANKNDSYTILNNIANKDKIFTSNWIKKQFPVDDIKIDYGYVPEVDDTNIDYLKDALIFVLTNERHSSIWYYDNNEGSSTYGQFTYVLDPAVDNGQALRLTIFDSDMDLTSYIQALQDAHLALLLAVDDDSLGQTAISNEYLTIRNRTADEYNDAHPTMSEYTEDYLKYKNDLNMYIEYDNRKETRGNYSIAYYDPASGKYFTTFLNADNKSNMINSYMYPNAEKITTTKHTYTTSQLKLEIEKIAKYKYISNIIIDGNELRTEETIAQYIDEQYAQGTEEIEHTVEINTTTYDNTTSYYREYIPNCNIPQADLKEILIRNVNLINRLNILSFDNVGNIYNSYIGTSYEESDKSTLYFGTTNNNINVGSETLMEDLDRRKFATHDKLNISFNNIDINTVNNLTLNGNNLTTTSNTNTINSNQNFFNGLNIKTYTYNNITYNTASFIPVGYLDDSVYGEVLDNNEIEVKPLGIRYMDKNYIEKKYSNNFIEDFKNNIGYDTWDNHDIFITLNDFQNYIEQQLAKSNEYIFTRINKYVYDDTKSVNEYYSYDIERFHDAININNLMSLLFNINLLDNKTYSGIDIDAGTNLLFKLTGSYTTIEDNIKHQRLDINNDNKVDISDAIAVINYIDKLTEGTRLKEYFDVNGDGKVDISDWIMFINNFGIINEDNPLFGKLDFNKDGYVDINDVVAFWNYMSNYSGIDEYITKYDLNLDDNGNVEGDGVIDDKDAKTIIDYIATQTDKKYEYFYLVINDDTFNTNTNDDMGQINIMGETINITYWIDENKILHIKIRFGTNNKPDIKYKYQQLTNQFSL